MMVRVTSLYSRLDKKATAENAAAMLSDYPHRLARSRAWSMDLQSPVMDGMPRNDSIENRAESKVVDHLDDEQFVRRCDNIVRAITNETYQNILRFTYMQPLESVEAIEERMFMAPSTYRRQRVEALVAFAELWPPVPSNLLVYSA